MSALRHFYPYCLALLCLSGVIFLQQTTLNNNKNLSNNEVYVKEEKGDQFFLKTQAKLPTLGFDNLLADWTFLRLIQYFGDTSARDSLGYQLVPQFFKIVVDRDPRFVQALLMLSSANTMYAYQPQKTVSLLDQALKSIKPQLSYLTPYVWSYKGVDEMLFLGDNKASQHSFEMAAKWAKERGGKDDLVTAKRNQDTADFLAKNPDSKKARVGAWMNILEGALEDRVRKQAIHEIQSLGGKVSLNKDGNLEIIFPEKD